MANIYKSNYTGAQVDAAIEKVLNAAPESGDALQKKLKEGTNITIATDGTISATAPDNSYSVVEITSSQTTLTDEQYNTLTASSFNKIKLSNTVYNLYSETTSTLVYAANYLNNSYQITITKSTKAIAKGNLSFLTSGSAVSSIRNTGEAASSGVKGNLILGTGLEIDSMSKTISTKVAPSVGFYKYTKAVTDSPVVGDTYSYDDTKVSYPTDCAYVEGQMIIDINGVIYKNTATTMCECVYIPASGESNYDIVTVTSTEGTLTDDQFNVLNASPYNILLYEATIGTVKAQIFFRRESIGKEAITQIFYKGFYGINTSEWTATVSKIGNNITYSLASLGAMLTKENIFSDTTVFNKNNIINDLNYSSDNSSTALSAYQGYLLNNRLKAVESTGGSSSSSIEIIDLGSISSFPASGSLTTEQLNKFISWGNNGVNAVKIYDETESGGTYPIAILNGDYQTKNFYYTGIWGDNRYTVEVGLDNSLSSISTTSPSSGTYYITKSSSSSGSSADDEQKAYLGASFQFSSMIGQTSYVSTNIDSSVAGLTDAEITGLIFDCSYSESYSSLSSTSYSYQIRLDDLYRMFTTDSMGVKSASLTLFDQKFSLVFSDITTSYSQGTVNYNIPLTITPAFSSSDDYLAIVIGFTYKGFKFANGGTY